MRQVALAVMVGLAAAGCGSDESGAGSGGAGGAGGSGGVAGGSGGSAPLEVPGCSAEVSLLASSEDFSLPGAWPVGVRTAQLGGLTAEIWYPAEPGSEAGVDPKIYDVRSWLPDSEKGKIPDADNPWQSSSSYPDLPLDAAHGPYPAVVFVHGTAGFRTQSLAHMEHWASRGFVVVAADHPGLYLGDMLSFNLTKDLPGDLDKLVAAIGATSEGLGFMKGKLDATRLGMVGHSAGGAAIGSRGDDAQVLIPLAAGGSTPGEQLVSTLVMGGLADQVVAYDKTKAGYTTSPSKKRLVGLAKAGHLFPSGLCFLENTSGETILTVAQKYQIKNAGLAGALFDCPADQLSETDARAVVNFATSAVLEQTLHCRTGVTFVSIQSTFPAVSELEESL
ncbi:MAG: hypothetical protein IPI67_40280 [Myxococcales bacterium]|nr:hypothetical protein [Myxococcales bacterium]